MPEAVEDCEIDRGQGDYLNDDIYGEPGSKRRLKRSEIGQHKARKDDPDTYTKPEDDP